MLKKIREYGLFFCFLILITGCSVSGRLERNYEGSTRDLLLTDLGEPKRIVKMDNGNELFIYEKETFVRETPIGTGRSTLDPRISPSFIKLEEFKFLIDSNGRILTTEYIKSIKK